MRHLKLTPKTIGAVAGLLIASIIITISCNKQESANSSKQFDDDFANAKKNAALQVEKNGISSTFNVDNLGELFYVDKNGKRLSKEYLAKKYNNKITSSCNYSNTPVNGGITVTESYTCGVGYKISWTHNFSTNNNIVLVNPYNPNPVTKGIIQISDNTNKLVYSQTVTNVVIKDLGLTVGGISGYENYSVTFTSDWITNVSYFNVQAQYTIKMGAFYVTDCPDNEFTPPSIQQDPVNINQNAPTNPCLRND